MYGYGMDITYVLVLIGAVLSMIASANVNSTYKKYSKIGNAHGYTAEQVAQKILRESGCVEVRIDRVKGDLTDHYSSSEKVLRLSDTVYGSASVAAIGVAAHECGHAIQDKENYWAMGVRHAAVPISNIGSKLSWPIIILGLVLGWTGLAQIGVFLFLFVVFFQLITLPVEFDASRRALRILEDGGILEGAEMKGATKVLKAAAMTYVAALASAILQLLRLVLLTRRRD